MRPAPPRPSRDQLAAAFGKGVRDVIAPGLRVLFCGINPGLYTAAIGHHFGRPGNRFWPALHRSGFTPSVVSPYDERALLDLGLGVTNLVKAATARADELTADELRAGGRALARKVARYRPRSIAVLGLGAYRSAFARPAATIGPQPDDLAGAMLWVLPSPSGLNAHYGLDALAAELREFRESLQRE